MAKSPYDIAPNASFREAAAAALRPQMDALMLHLHGTRAGDDIEALHDMRVASRRLRAALSVFAPVYPPRRFRPVEKQVARVTDALGAVRDADVQMEFIEHARAAAPESARVGLEAFLAHLGAQRAADRVHLVRALDALEKGRLRRDFDAMLRSALPGEGEANG